MQQLLPAAVARRQSANGTAPLSGGSSSVPIRSRPLWAAFCTQARSFGSAHRRRNAAADTGGCARV